MSTAQTLENALLNDCTDLPALDFNITWGRFVLGVFYGVTLGPEDGTIYWDEIHDQAFSGQDNIDNNLDTADLVMLGTHGASDYGVQWYPRLTSKDYREDPNGRCFGMSTEMYVGNDYANFLDAFACFSNDISLAGHMAAHTPLLHQYHGFYGISNELVGDYVGSYISDAFSAAAAHAWLENMTVWNPWGDGYDICGTSLVRGSSNLDAYTRMEAETYSGTTWSHPNGSAYRYLFYCNCNAHHNYGPLTCE